MADELYSPDTPLSMKDSASLFPNNLSTWGAGGTMHYVVSTKGSVNIIIAKSGGTMQKNLAGKDSSLSQPIMQAKFIPLNGNLFLILTTFHGVQIHSANDQRLVYFHPLSPDPNKPDEEIYAQGVAAISDSKIAVGLSSGRILIFKKDGNTFIVSETLQGHSNPICDIKSSLEDNKFFTSDDNGCILVWAMKGSKWEIQHTFEGAGSPCSSMSVYKNFVIGGFGSGHIRVFNFNEGVMSAEITAHARWINAIDVNARGLLLSVSEDTIANVWDLNKMSLHHSFSLPNVQLCGAQFLQGSDDFALTGYDMKDIMIFKHTELC